MSTDLDLVERFQKGDENAFEELVKRHRTKVFNMVKQIVRGNAAEADDLSQEVFLHVYRGLKKFQKQASFTTWLYRITANCCHDHLRGLSRKPLSYLEDIPVWQGEMAVTGTGHNVNPEQEAEKAELKWHLKQALADLPVPYRTALVLYAWHGMTYKEISEIMKCPIGTVMSRLNFARKKIRAFMEYAMREDSK
ncbi:MAG: RNA polymerase sigma factor [Bacillota bacterium]